MGGSLLHLNLLSLLQLRQDAQTLLVVALIAQITGNLDLLLDLLRVLQNVDRQDTLGLDRLAIRTICR